MNIRRAEKSDIELIRQLADVAFRDTYKDILSADQMEYMMEWMYSSESMERQMDEGHVYFIVSDGNRNVGYLSLEPQGSTEGVNVYHLQKLYLLPEEQGKGYGRRMFQFAVDYVRGQGNLSSRIELNVNRNNKALTFYEHLGMRRLRQGDFPIGNGYFMNDYIMGYDV